MFTGSIVIGVSLLPAIINKPGFENVFLVKNCVDKKYGQDYTDYVMRRKNGQV
jgi:hypothetical protein